MNEESEDPRLEIIKKKFQQGNISEEEKEALIEEAQALGWKLSVDVQTIDACGIQIPIVLLSCGKMYNPKYCDTCEKVTEHSKYGHCLVCKQPITG